MKVMAVSINEICESTKLAREMAVMGNYESSSVYYQGVIQQIHKLLLSILDETRRSKWQLVSIYFPKYLDLLSFTLGTINLCILSIFFYHRLNFSYFSFPFITNSQLFPCICSFQLIA